LTVGIVIALAAGIKLNWSRLPRWTRWPSVIVAGLLGVGLLGVMLTDFVSGLCQATRSEAASALLVLGGTVVILGAVYLRMTGEQMKQLRRANEALQRRIAADHPKDDVSVAEDGSVTFKPRTR
jgi:Na+/H+ antiporter NhaA